MEILMATNSAPNIDVYIFACFLDNYWISTVFKKMKNPERDLLVLFSPACLLSAYPRRSTPSPLYLGSLVGMDYFNLP